MKTFKLPSPHFSVIAGPDPQSMDRVAVDAGSMSGMTNRKRGPIAITGSAQQAKELTGNTK